MIKRKYEDWNPGEILNKSFLDLYGDDSFWCEAEQYLEDEMLKHLKKIKRELKKQLQ